MKYIYDVHKISYSPFPSSPYSIFVILFSLQLYALFGLKETTLFFLINNVRILLTIERLPNRVHWGCTMGAQIRKQKNNGQETKKRRNKKNEKKLFDHVSVM